MTATLEASEPDHIAAMRARVAILAADAADRAARLPRPREPFSVTLANVRALALGLSLIPAPRAVPRLATRDGVPV